MICFGLETFFLPFYREFSTVSTLIDGIFDIKTEGSVPVNIIYKYHHYLIFGLSYMAVTPLSLSISSTKLTYKQNVSISLLDCH